MRLNTRSPEDSAAAHAKAFATGRAAFQAIAARLADHMRYGKSEPNRPRCPFRIETKRQAWRDGYCKARDEFWAVWHEDRSGVANEHA